MPRRSLIFVILGKRNDRIYFHRRRSRNAQSLGHADDLQRARDRLARATGQGLHRRAGGRRQPQAAADRWSCPDRHNPGSGAAARTHPSARRLVRLCSGGWHADDRNYPGRGRQSWLWRLLGRSANDRACRTRRERLRNQWLVPRHRYARSWLPDRRRPDRAKPCACAYGADEVRREHFRHACRATTTSSTPTCMARS